ncbi:MAG: GNAT family N-acetyltransferase [Verrucomicrobiaceae bacterium]|nr:GNAT family N-acetyltransferase [Verrucomicrobiaceae bacterium]
MKIRKAKDADREEWFRMRTELWPDSTGDRHELEIEQLIESGGVVFVAEGEGGALRGFVEVSIRRDHVPGASSTPIPYIEGWYVDVASRGQGMGARLVRAAEDWARDRAFHEIASDAVIDNEDSIRAHAALGFRETSREVHFIKALE